MLNMKMMHKDRSMKVIPDRVILSPSKERPYLDTPLEDKTAESEGKVDILLETLSNFHLICHLSL